MQPAQPLTNGLSNGLEMSEPIVQLCRRREHLCLLASGSWTEYDRNAQGGSEQPGQNSGAGFQEAPELWTVGTGKAPVNTAAVAAEDSGDSVDPDDDIDCRLSEGLDALEEEVASIFAHDHVDGLELLLAPTAGHTEAPTWNNDLLAFFVRVSYQAMALKIPVDVRGLPQGLGRLIKLALAVPPQEGTAKTRVEEGLLEYVGGQSLAMPGVVLDAVNFLGETSQSIGRFLVGRSACNSRELWQALCDCGAAALPIVSLTSLLLGLIFAFVGSIQLRLFGAEVYVADLVAVAMVRVMGPVLTGIVLAGRTGASFAAIIGSMQVNEEVDALVAFGISPVDFLVLPRVLALTIMMPLLTLYSNIMGILGGFLVGVFMLGLSANTYWNSTLASLSLTSLWIGLIHAVVFGLLISMTGCYQGMKCGRNAAAVGQATTSAVVTSIVGIIVSTSIITIICTVIGI